MVKRLVKIAHIVCAVYSLGNPNGSTHVEITKFCALRFGTSRVAREFDTVLKNAVENNFLICFQRRYRLARVGHYILRCQGWQTFRDGDQTPAARQRKGRCLGRKKDQKRGKARCNQKKRVAPKRIDRNKSSYSHKRCRVKQHRSMMRQKRTCKRDASRSNKRKVPLNKKGSLKEKVSRRDSSRRERRAPVSHAGIRTGKECSCQKRASICKKRSCHVGISRKEKTTNSRVSSRKKVPSHKNASSCKKSSPLRISHKAGSTCKSSTKSPRSVHRCSKKDILELKRNHYVEKREQMKSQLRSRKTHRKKSCSHIKKVKKHPQPTKNCFSESSDEEEEVNNQCVHREALRQTKLAVAHAGSWDHLNDELQKEQRRNDQLLRTSKLVHRILTDSHSASWDDLNNKLRVIKAAASKPEEGGE